MALSSTVLATPALARDGSGYFGGEIGAMIVEDIDMDIDEGVAAVGIDSEYGYDAALFAGFDMGMFRIEAEIAQKQADVDALETNFTLPENEGTPRAGQRLFENPRGSTRVRSAMLNAMLDFGDDEGVSGFLGGGVGYAWTRMRAGAYSNTDDLVDDHDSGFAWQVLAGVRQAITPNVDVHLKYRFFNAPGLEFTNGTEVGEARFRSHSLLGGLTFNFGAPPPPPVVVAPPPPPPYVPPPAPVPTPPVVTPVGPFIVFFDWDRSDITPQAAAILDNAAAAYQSTGQAQVVLAGHADRSGSADYNVGLSQRRADAVRSYLSGRGVPAGAIATEAFGESRPLVETADGVREPQNRRVEITFGPGSGM
jgi:outer membrane protein OmpA-like peptidoglycan-associated protein/opacity protein-like surface antigen